PLGPDFEELEAAKLAVAGAPGRGVFLEERLLGPGAFIGQPPAELRPSVFGSPGHGFHRNRTHVRCRAVPSLVSRLGRRLRSRALWRCRGTPCTALRRARRRPAFLRPDRAAEERQNGVTGRPGPTGVHLPGSSGGRTPE